MAAKSVPARVHGSTMEAPALVWRQVKASWPEGAPQGGPMNVPGAARESNAELETTLAGVNARVQAAQAQGLRDGLAQGRAEGEERARTQLEPLMERLARTVADLSGTRDAFRREAEEDVVRLSLGIARRILHRELSIDPEALLGVIHVALSKFEARELHRVLVSTEDHPAVAAALQLLKLPRRVEVIADPTLERGAAFFETVKGTLDASVDTQLDEIERGFLDVLGKDARRG